MRALAQVLPQGGCLGPRLRDHPHLTIEPCELRAEILRDASEPFAVHRVVGGRAKVGDEIGQEQPAAERAHALVLRRRGQAADDRLNIAPLLAEERERLAAPDRIAGREVADGGLCPMLPI